MFEFCFQIFGKDIIDAMLSEGMLFVMHQNNLLKIYSWDDMADQVRFRHEYYDLRNLTKTEEV